MDQHQLESIFKNVLELEAKTLENMAKNLPKNLFDLMEDLYLCKGKIICSGIGKSAIIAQKMVATFNSTGTPSAFLHASEALHGDLGMIQKEDRVLLLSKSGNTSEIKQILPHLKKIARKVYGITANPNSFLAENADGFIHSLMENEACPNNLAPTVSTTLQLAIGDALAVCLMNWRGFSAEQFGFYHPAGSLGKKTSLKVKDLLRVQKPKIFLTANLQEIILEISEKRLGATVVLDEKNHLKGVITDGDLRRMLQKYPPEAWQNIKAQDILTKNPKIIGLENLVAEALVIFEQYKINQLIVLDENQNYQGILHLNDLLEHQDL